MSYERAAERNRRLKKRYKKLGNKMTSGVWYNEDVGRYIEYHAPRRVKYFRNRANKKIRRNKAFFGNNGTYKKACELWREVW